jgi:hypothetical protein
LSRATAASSRKLVNLLPETYRVIIAPFVGMVAFGVVTWARLHVQPKLRNDGQ